MACNVFVQIFPLRCWHFCYANSVFLLLFRSLFLLCFFGGRSDCVVWVASEKSLKLNSSFEDRKQGPQKKVGPSLFWAYILMFRVFMILYIYMYILVL